MLPQFLQLPLITHFSTSKQCEIHNCNTQSVLFFLFNLLGSTTYQCACCISHCHYVQFSTLPLTTRYTTASTFHVAFPTAIELLQLPLVDNYTPACTTLQNIFHHHQLLNLQVVLSSLLQPANTTALTTPSSFRVAFHQLSSISHGLFYYCLFSQQTQPQRYLLLPLHFVLQFPLPLGSHFPPPLTTESTSCSIVPSPTSKHNEIHVWAFTIASTHHFASAMQSAHHPSSNQQTQPQRALTTASTAMTPPLTTCCSPSKHSTLHSSSSISHFTTAISTGSPSCLTSVKYTTPQINYPLPA